MSFVLAADAAEPGTALDPSTMRVLATQVALDRAGFSPGAIDAKAGGNTDRALRAFQQANGLPATGELDTETIARLGAPFENPLSTYAISAEDAAGPFVAAIPTDMMKKADLDSLGYTSVRELLAERFHSSPKLLDRLNTGAAFEQGTVLTVPNVEAFALPARTGAKGASGASGATGASGAKGASGATGASGAAGASGATGASGAKSATGAKAPAPTGNVVTVTDRTKTLQVEDATGKVIFHAPVTTGSANDPLPIGEWKVNGVDRNPSFNYNPDLFWDADPKHSKAKLAPGPNNPVGVAWIDLSKEHYGIHGTPEPTRIGYTESHGCIRLTNWDVTRLASLVGPGTKVILR